MSQRDDALTANREPRSCRVLAQAGPGMFRPDLATSLNTLSIQLGGLGRREKALAGIKEAVTIWRSWLQGRGAYDHDLEQSLRVVA